MIAVECPDCGVVAQLPSARPTATAFCTGCDYPMFWALPEDSPVDDEVEAAGALDPTLRRRPGTAGRVTPTSEVCRACGELNQIDAVYCLRCGVELHPAPVVEVEVPKPKPPPPPPPEPEPFPLEVAIAAAVAFVGLVILAGLYIGAGASAALLLAADAVGLVLLRNRTPTPNRRPAASSRRAAGSGTPRRG